MIPDLSALQILALRIPDPQISEDLREETLEAVELEGNFKKVNI